MAFEYSVNDVIQWLKDDQEYNGMECKGAWKFIIERFLKLQNSFKVKSMIGKPFDGEVGMAIVSTGATDRTQALEWAKDALREWAGCGVGRDAIFADGTIAAPDYFSLIAREYANEGPGKGHTAKSIGTTLDFLTLLSRFGSAHGRKHPNIDMYEGVGQGRDVPEILCFVYANMYHPTDQAAVKLGLASKDNHLAAIRGSYGKGPNGLNGQYYDYDDIEDDQTHHFAAYFCHGASHGLSEWKMHIALWASSDYDWRNDKVLNQGDWDLGWVGAKWGDSFKRKPRFIGKEVEAALQRRDDNVKAPVPDK